jgi:phosphatidylserine decarboxylase
MMSHQYFHRQQGTVVSEPLMGDRLVQLLYGPAREKAPYLFKMLTSARSSHWLSYIFFDCALRHNPKAARKIFRELRLDPEECVDSALAFTSVRAVFERQIKYWRYRPMPAREDCVVAPADSKMLIGSLCETTALFIKEKFFQFEELIGSQQHRWQTTFRNGDFAVCRLTPEKYHYNHFPVTGRVVDFYTIEGAHHSCNPTAVVSEVTPYSKNKRVVTIIDTDVAGGSGVGYVAMIEIVALMIGDIVQCYSAYRYDDPVDVVPGLYARRGQPKSLFRPGSSVNVLFFEKDRTLFDADLVANRDRYGVMSRFSMGFRQPLVETDVAVRSSIATATGTPPNPKH